MQLKRMLAAAGVLVLGSGGVAVATHVATVDPTTVPTGFFSTHTKVNNVPSEVSRLARRGRMDVFTQHARLAADAATAWHTHPGPGIVSVVAGTLTYEDAQRGKCRRKTYRPGQGFVDRGFGHVHRAVAGPTGADFYVTYLTPRRAPTQTIEVNTPPAECTP
jgi:quercetin dioxygenase-like cupin family protein